MVIDEVEYWRRRATVAESLNEAGSSDDPGLEYWRKRAVLAEFGRTTDTLCADMIRLEEADRVVSDEEWREAARLREIERKARKAAKAAALEAFASEMGYGPIK